MTVMIKVLYIYKTIFDFYVCLYCIVCTQKQKGDFQFSRTLIQLSKCLHCYGDYDVNYSTCAEFYTLDKKFCKEEYFDLETSAHASTKFQKFTNTNQECKNPLMCCAYHIIDIIVSKLRSDFIKI